MDVLSKTQRTRNMRNIRSVDTGPEMVVRRGLHALGYRYRIHARNLPGTPDIALPRYRVAVFVHGCFWHGHQCKSFRWPKTRHTFWTSKIRRTQERDKAIKYKLQAIGWRTLEIWECALRGPGSPGLAAVLRRSESFFRSQSRLTASISRSTRT
jgi:DNA mismatch endonuclease (patch repair protein)